MKYQIYLFFTKLLVPVEIWTLVLILATCNVNGPLIIKENFPFFTGFIVHKTTGLILRSQRRNWLWKACTRSKDIAQNVPKYESWVWQHKLFLQILVNNSGLKANFSNQLLRWNPGLKPVIFKILNPLFF